jgi:hypothetical protein
VYQKALSRIFADAPPPGKFFKPVSRNYVFSVDFATVFCIMELIFRRPISIRGQSEPDSGRTDSGRKPACAKFLQKRLRKNFVNKQFSKKSNVRVFKKSNSEEH